MKLPKYVYKASYNTMGSVVHIENEDLLNKGAAICNIIDRKLKSRIIDVLEIPAMGSGFNFIPAHKIYIAEIISTKKLDGAEIEKITIDLLKDFSPIAYERFLNRKTY